MRTFAEAKKYQSSILASAMDWANGQHTIDAEEVVFLADYYGVNLPLYFNHFIYSYAPGHVCADRAHKGILRTLESLERAIRGKEATA